jgi:hypothetical protein
VGGGFVLVQALVAAEGVLAAFEGHQGWQQVIAVRSAPPFEARIAEIAQGTGGGDAGAEIGFGIAAPGDQRLLQALPLGRRNGHVGLGGRAPGERQVDGFQRGHETRRVRRHGGGQGEGLFPAGGGGGRQRIGIGQGGEGVLEARRHLGGPPGAPDQLRFRPGRDGASGKVFLEQLVDEQHVVPLFLDDMQRLAALEQAFRLLAAPEEQEGLVPAGADP